MIRLMALALVALCPVWSFPPEEPVFFLQETFEDGIELVVVDNERAAESNAFTRWVTYPTNSRWKWEQGEDACNGLGYMVAPATVTCTASTLATPYFSVPETISELRISYIRRFMGTAKQSAPISWSVIGEDGSTQALKTQVVSRKVDGNCEIITQMGQVSQRRMRLAIQTPDNCAGLLVDQLTVRGSDLDVAIVAPAAERLALTTDESYTFQAELSEPNSGATIKWLVREQSSRGTARIFSGPSAVIPFPTPGVYEVLCTAVSPYRIDPKPARREVQVSPVQVAITHPVTERRRPVMVDQGSTVTFTGTINDGKHAVRTIRWLRGSDVICSETVTPAKTSRTTQCDIPFPNTGFVGVTLVALDANGATVGEEMQVVGVSLELEALIAEPAPFSEVPTNAELRLVGQVLGSLASDPDTHAFWQYNGQVYPGTTATVPTAGHGRRHARFMVRNDRVKKGDQEVVHFMVVDPEHSAQAKITQPISDWWVPVGQSMYFEASYGDAPESERSIYWKISSPTGETVAESTSPILGEVTFTTGGVYTAELYFRGDGTERLMDQREIHVMAEPKEGGRTNFESPFIGNGVYTGFELNREYYFQVNVGKDGRAIQMELDFEEGAEVLFYKDGIEQPPVSVCVTGKRTLRLDGLDTGNYTWGVRPSGSCGTASKKSGFSFSISVLDPALYFADIVTDKDYTTQLGIINTTGELAEISIVGYDNDGHILQELSYEIGPKGILRDVAANLFGDLATEVTWVQVNSTHSLVGYSQTVSVDQLESYAVSAAKSLQRELYVPHIAEKTNTWYTKASLINGQEDDIEPFLTTPLARVVDMDNELSFSKDTIDFQSSFGGEVPKEESWGAFSDETGSSSLAGNEIFGTKDGTRQVVGLGLAGSVKDNPNFVTSSNKLFFTHIANPENFWTGIALVNRGTVPQGAQLIARGEDGALIGSGTLILQASEKIVAVASELLQMAQIPTTGVEWLEIEADAEITGYELFGSLGEGGKRLAGIEAITDISESLCMPFLDPTGALWHGVSVVNAEDTPANLTLSLRSESGEELACVEESLLGKEKKIFNLEILFPNIPANAGWVEVMSSGKIVGFELFGDESNQFMSGLIAQ